MKEWKNPELWDLNIDKTMAQLGGGGNDQYIKDCVEHFLEDFFDIEIGRKS